MDSERQCIQCGSPLENRRPDALFCRQRCKRRYYRRGDSSSYAPPPPAGTIAFAQSHAGTRFRAQLADHDAISQPLTPGERDLLRLQRANPGVLLEPLRQRVLERAEAGRQAEEETRAQFRPVKVEDRLDPASLGSLARRAIQSRTRNKPADPHLHVLRPGQPGPHPPDDSPECIQAPWSRGRWH